MKDRKRPQKQSSPVTREPNVDKKAAHNIGSESRISWLRTAAVIPVVAMAMAGWFYNNRSESSDYSVFMPASTVTEKAVYTVPCSSDYKDEPFTDCKPSVCGRVVMDDVVSREEADHLLRMAKQGLSYGGSSGGASILDLHSGALSKGSKFVNFYSLLEGEAVLTDNDFTVYKNVKNKIKKAITDHFHIPMSSLYLTKPTFFSRMNMTEPKTVHDEYWHPHVDKVTYGSFHYTSLLYLTTYGEDFTGGRFVFIDKDANRTVEPRKGRVSFFTSGSENVHFVERLKDGVRYAITISFTCDPDKAIAEPNHRSS